MNLVKSLQVSGVLVFSLVSMEYTAAHADGIFKKRNKSEEQALIAQMLDPIKKSGKIDTAHFALAEKYLHKLLHADNAKEVRKIGVKAATECGNRSSVVWYALDCDLNQKSPVHFDVQFQCQVMEGQSDAEALLPQYIDQANYAILQCASTEYVLPQSK